MFSAVFQKLLLAQLPIQNRNARSGLTNLKEFKVCLQKVWFKSWVFLQKCFNVKWKSWIIKNTLLSIVWIGADNPLVKNYINTLTMYEISYNIQYVKEITVFAFDRCVLLWQIFLLQCSRVKSLKIFQVNMKIVKNSLKQVVLKLNIMNTEFFLDKCLYYGKFYYKLW